MVVEVEALKLEKAHRITKFGNNARDRSLFHSFPQANEHTGNVTTTSLIPFIG